MLALPPPGCSPPPPWPTSTPAAVMLTEEWRARVCRSLAKERGGTPGGNCPVGTLLKTLLLNL
jgi:hypothetical protein